MNSHFWVNYKERKGKKRKKQSSEGAKTHLGRFTEHEAYNVTSKWQIKMAPRAKGTKSTKTILAPPAPSQSDCRETDEIKPAVWLKIQYRGGGTDIAFVSLLLKSMFSVQGIKPRKLPALISETPWVDSVMEAFWMLSKKGVIVAWHSSLLR